MVELDKLASWLNEKTLVYYFENYSIERKKGYMNVKSNYERLLISIFFDFLEYKFIYPLISYFSNIE